MFIITNSLSLIRVPLTFLFINENNVLRVVIIFLAMFSDSIDGYIARKYNATSTLGAILDPLMDKFFVYGVLIILCLDGSITPLFALSMLFRDYFLIMLGLYLCFSKKILKVQFKSVKFGKISTAFQFIILILVSLKIKLMWPALSILFFLLGFLAFIELVKYSTIKKRID